MVGGYTGRRFLGPGVFRGATEVVFSSGGAALVVGAVVSVITGGVDTTSVAGSSSMGAIWSIESEVRATGAINDASYVVLVTTKATLP